jgi:hypothetical protein
MGRAAWQDACENYENRKLPPSQKVRVVFGFRHNNFTDLRVSILLCRSWYWCPLRFHDQHPIGMSRFQSIDRVSQPRLGRSRRFPSSSYRLASRIPNPMPMTSRVASQRCNHTSVSEGMEVVGNGTDCRGLLMLADHCSSSLHVQIRMIEENPLAKAIEPVAVGRES